MIAITRLSLPARALLAAFAAVGSSALAAPPDPFVAAIVVGHNPSRDAGVAPLRFADDDAARYYELFASTADHAVLLAVLDPPTQRRHPDAARVARAPSRAELERAVREVADRVREAAGSGRTAELVFVYAGHGSRTAEGEGYVNLLDGVLRRRDLFKDVLSPVPAAYKHVIVDACNAYFLVAKRGEATAAEVKAVAEFLDREALDGHPEVGVLVSGTREVETHEWAALESGVFSHEIRSALLGAADADGDGLVRYAEVAAFIAAANEGLADPRARVDVFARPPALDLARPIADLRRGERRFLEIPGELRGHARVEDGRGARYAEVNLSGETPVVLRLVGRGDYYVFRGDREAHVPDAEAGVALLAAASFGPVRSATRGAVEDDLRRGLFAVPYGIGFLRGFLARDPSLGALPPPSARFPDANVARIELPAAPGTPWTRKVGIGAIAGATALGAGSAVAGYLAQSQYDRFMTRLAREGTYDPAQVRAIEDARLATNLLLAGAIVSGGAGALLLLLTDSRGPRVALAPGPGIAVVVEF